MEGWVKLHRHILDNPICKKPKYAWLWIILLLKANHKDKTFIWNNKKQVCKMGQIITGRKELSLNSGISPSSVERGLTYLESEHQIKQQKTTKFRLITILNWDKYQIDGQQIVQQTDNKRTTNGQQTDTNNNDNNDKNDKNDKEINIYNQNEFAKFYKNFDKKIKYEEFVYMTEMEYNKLVTKHGKTVIHEAMIKLNAWKLEKLAQGDKKACQGDDYRKMIKWAIIAVLKDLREINPKGYYKAVETNEKFKDNPELINKINELAKNTELSHKRYLEMTEFEILQRWRIYQKELKEKGVIQNV